MPPALEVDQLSAGYQHRLVLQDISFTCPAGVIVGVVGPNGAGKSTLFKAILGLVPPAAGSVRLFGESLHRQRRRVAYVPQREMVDWDFPATVKDVVMMGRVARIGWLRRPSRTDREQVDAALHEVRLAQLADRPIGQLSGGQQQRVFLARALAQGADVLLLDEPFTGVDAPTEAVIERVLGRLRESGKTILVVTHDLGAANRYDLVVLLRGRLVACGPPSDVLTPDRLRAVYGTRLPVLDPAAVRGWLPGSLPADPARS